MCKGCIRAAPVVFSRKERGHGRNNFPVPLQILGLGLAQASLGGRSTWTGSERPVFHGCGGGFLHHQQIPPFWSRQKCCGSFSQLREGMQNGILELNGVNGFKGCVCYRHLVIGGNARPVRLACCYMLGQGLVGKTARSNLDRLRGRSARHQSQQASLVAITRA